MQSVSNSGQRRAEEHAERGDSARYGGHGRESKIAIMMMLMMMMLLLLMISVVKGGGDCYELERWGR